MKSLPSPGLEGSEIDRSGGGESFAAMRHLNWLNADKLQCYTPLPPPQPRGRAFSALFPGSAIAAVEDSPSGSFLQDVCAGSSDGGFYVSDAVSRLQWTASRRSLRDSPPLLFSPFIGRRLGLMKLFAGINVTSGTATLRWSRFVVHRDNAWNWDARRKNLRFVNIWRTSELSWTAEKM